MSEYFRQNATISTGFEQDKGWAIMSPIENTIKQKIESIGVPLKQWDVQINRGILTGFNEAFIIGTKIKDELIAKSPENAEIIRPIILGKNLKRYKYSWENTWLINSHNGLRSKNILPINLEIEYPTIFEYLSTFLPKIKDRADQGNEWYNLRNCAYIHEFDKPKIVWGNLATRNQFAFIQEPMVINNPSNFISTDNLYILGVLNSKLADYYIKQLGVTRNGGYFEYKPMFVGELPIPKASAEKQTEVIKIVNQILESQKNNVDTKKLEAEIDNIIYDIYQLTLEEINLINTI